MILETLSEVEAQIRNDSFLNELHELPILRKLWNLICELPQPLRDRAAKSYFRFLYLLAFYQTEAIDALLAIEDILSQDGYDAPLVHEVLSKVAHALYG